MAASPSPAVACRPAWWRAVAVLAAGLAGGFAPTESGAATPGPATQTRAGSPTGAPRDVGMAASATDWGLALIDLLHKLAEPDSAKRPAGSRSMVDKALHPCALTRHGAGEDADAEGSCLVAAAPALRAPAKIWAGPDQTVRAIALQVPGDVGDGWLRARPQWQVRRLACLRGGGPASGEYSEVTLPGRRPLVVGLVHWQAAALPSRTDIMVAFGRDLVPPEGSPAVPSPNSAWTRNCEPGAPDRAGGATATAVTGMVPIAAPAEAATRADAATRTRVAGWGPVRGLVGTPADSSSEAPAESTARPLAAAVPSLEPAMLEQLLDRRLRIPPLDCDSGSYQVFTRAGGWQQFAAGKAQVPPISPLVHFTPTIEGFWLHMLFPANDAIRVAVGDVAAGEYVFDVRALPPDHVLIIRRGLELDQTALDKGRLAYRPPTVERSVVRVCSREPPLVAAGVGPRSGTVAVPAAVEVSSATTARAGQVPDGRAARLADVMAALARPVAATPRSAPERDLVTVTERLSGCRLRGDLVSGRSGTCVFKLASGKGEVALPFAVTLHGAGYRVSDVVFEAIAPLPARWKLARRQWQTTVLACRSGSGAEQRWVEVATAGEPTFYVRADRPDGGTGRRYTLALHFSADAVPPLGPAANGNDWASRCSTEAAQPSAASRRTDPTVLAGDEPPPPDLAGGNDAASATSASGARRSGADPTLRRPPTNSPAWIPPPLAPKKNPGAATTSTARKDG